METQFDQQDLNTKNQKHKSWWSAIQRYAVPGILALYLSLVLIALGWILLDISTNSFNTLKWIGIILPQSMEFIAILKLVLYAAIGGAMGGIVYGMQNLWKYTTADKFKIVFAGDYVFRPFGSAALAVAIFALIRGGVLSALGVQPTAGMTSTVSSFSSFAIGFLSGFGSYQVINKLDELIKQVFGKQPEAESQEKITHEKKLPSG